MANQTCGLSGLPIKDGDDIVVFVLESTDQINDATAAYCYSYDVWRPWFLPVFAKYDDYSSICDVEKAEGKAILDFVLSELDPGVAGLTLKPHRMAAHEKPGYYDQLPEDVETLFNDFLREDGGRLRFKGMFRGNDCRLGYTMFHKSVYLDVLKRVGERKPYGKKEDFRTLSAASHKDAVKATREAYQAGAIIDALFRLSPEDIADKQKVMEVLQVDNEEAYQQKKQWLQPYIDRKSTKPPTLFSGEYSAFNGALFRHIYDAGALDSELLIERLTEYSLMKAAMELLGKLWMPGMICGSAEYDLRRIVMQSSEELIRAEEEKYGKRGSKSDEPFGAVELEWW